MNGVQRLNHWLDEMLLSLAPLLMKVGFVSGATDLLLSGTLATNPVFEIGWAVSQAIAVDSMFFIVASCLFYARGARDRWLFGVLMGLYGLVAFMVSDIQAFQQLQMVTAGVSMQSLHIAPQAFTHIRAALVVVTAVLYYLVEKKVHTLETVTPAVTDVTPEPLVELPEQAASLHEEFLVIVKAEPQIGPAELARRLGHHEKMSRTKAHRMLRTHAKTTAVREADGMATGESGGKGPQSVTAR